MRYLAFATDYDGTLARGGTVSESTITCLEQMLASGRRLILVTGRHLADLRSVFSRLELFDSIVAENGGVLYDPHSRQEKALAEPPNAQLVEWLRRRGVPLETGKTVIASCEPHEKTILEGIREFGLELHLIFNRDAVMVLPSAVNKGTGLLAALKCLGLSPHNVVGIGDAENDHEFFRLCECSVAVADAVPTLKERADLIASRAGPDGVREVIEQLLTDDLAGAEARLVRHQLLLGRAGQNEVRFSPHGTCILVAGPSGSGKSTIVSGLLERIAAAEYQFCIIDPEGDFTEVPDGVVLGDAGRVPATNEVLQLIDAFDNAVVSLLGVPHADRPAVFAELLPKIQERRARNGRPHWLVLDEVHHLLPVSWRPAPLTLPQALGSAILITVHPEHVSRAALALVNMVIAVGKNAEEVLQTFAEKSRRKLPAVPAAAAESRTVAVWDLRASRVLQVLPESPQAERRRHRRKYAEGDIQEKSFYFRGPQGKLKLRAQNLSLFVQMAAGVDHETWEHHLRQHDYSRWIREAIKDEALAEAVRRIEEEHLSADESRRRILAAVEEKYTRAA